MSFSVRDLERLGGAALQEFAEGIENGKSATARPATRLEAKLEQLYAIAVTMAQQEERLEAVEAIWAGMVQICDRMAKTLAPSSGTASHCEAYDRILDIRNACEENRALHA